VLAHLPQVAVVADVIAGARLLDVRVALGLAGASLDERERLEDRHRVAFAAAEIVDLGDPRSFDKRVDEPRNITRVGVVADLLGLVAENAVITGLDVALS
jgi:hypothetical protein